MNEKTGEIKEFASKEEAEKAGHNIEVFANPSCKKCYGRGYIGWRENGEKVLCSCLKPKW